jgi:hypothetical protein
MTTYQPAARISPTEIHQEPCHRASRDQGSSKKNGGAQQAALASPNRTWADALRVIWTNTLAVCQLTLHTVAKDMGFPYPFAANPHLLVTGRYSGSTNNKHELVFRHIFPAGQAATRELPQRWSTVAHTSINQRKELERNRGRS